MDKGEKVIINCRNSQEAAYIRKGVRLGFA